MDYTRQRDALITSLWASIRDKKVLDVMAGVPREVFVPQRVRQEAYLDEPLPIDYGQTISQPYIIALMTEALMLQGSETVLEVGTGSGYQTAILAGLARKVISVERIPGLLASARTILATLGINNIELHQAQDTLGWPQNAPYNAILVTAAAPRVPGELMTQLAERGKMVIPVGQRYSQELCRVTRYQDKHEVEYLGSCRFVSLIGKGAWDD